MGDRSVAQQRSTRRAVVGACWRNPDIRRAVLAMGAFRTAEIASWVAVTAFAYRAGGVDEASLVMAVQLVPSAAFGAVVGEVVHRVGASRVLRMGLYAQAAGFALVALAMAIAAPRPLVYLPAAFAAVAVTTTRPAFSALTPDLVNRPAELSQTNVVAGWVGAIASLLGPVLAAWLTAAFGVWCPLATMAVAVAIGAFGCRDLPNRAESDSSDAPGFLTGIRLVARAPGPRTMMLGIALHTVLVGAVDLLVVSLAVERLHRDEAYSGWLIAAFGLGGTLVLVLGVALVGRRWLAPWVVLSGGTTGVLLATLGPLNGEWALLAVLCACGGAAATYEVSSLMLLQRVTRLDLLGHVFGAVEGINMAMLALGAQVASLGVRWFGVSGALVAVGVVLAAGTLTLGPAIIGIDRNAQVPVVEMATIRRTPIFALLPGRALETLARESSLRDVMTGQRIVEQGQPGQEFFVVVDGELDVTIDGQFVRTLGRGGGFGEIALIHDLARTATVTARQPGRVLVVGRAAFLTAVAGHTSSNHRAATVAAERLADDEARGVVGPPI